MTVRTVRVQMDHFFSFSFMNRFRLEYLFWIISIERCDATVSGCVIYLAAGFCPRGWLAIAPQSSPVATVATCTSTKDDRLYNRRRRRVGGRGLVQSRAQKVNIQIVLPVYQYNQFAIIVSDQHHQAQPPPAHSFMFILSYTIGITT